MEYREFATKRAGFTHPERQGSQKEVLEQADAWSIFFESLVTARLQNPTNQPIMEHDQIEATLHQYESWCDGPARQLTESLYHNHTQRSRKLSNYLNFHIMNDAFMQHWYRLATGASWDSKQARAYNTEAQDYLAVGSLDTQQLARTADPLIRNNISGILAEKDAGIVALGVAMSHPELLILPAPGKFEHGFDSTKNADFLVFDTNQAEVIGAQVKSYVSEAEYNHYNSNFVFLIDTDTDLGDVIYQKPSGRSPARTIAKPGLVAAHHVSKWPKQTRLQDRPWLKRLTPDERSLNTMKFYAKSLTSGTKDASSLARQRIGERTLHHLYKKPTVSAKST